MNLTLQHRDHGDLLPIGAVVDAVRPTYPDVSHSSLRFLERRGLIEPHRTRGGHRLYSPDDVERILLIKRWQAQHLTLEQIGDRLRHKEHLADPTDLASTLALHLLSGDLSAARTIVLEADDAGLPLSRTFGGVLRPALIEVGRQWQAGTLLVAREKEITEFARDLVTTLADRHRHPRPGGPPLLAASVEGEFHDLGLRMVICLLRAGGGIVHFLGANVAPQLLTEALQVHRPAAVLLSARLSENLDAVRASVLAVRGVPSPEASPQVIVGGEIVHLHHDAIRSWGAITVDETDLDDIIASIRAIASSRAGIA